MRAIRRMVTIAALISISIAACTPEEFEAAFDLIVDLSEADRPTTRAAGQAAEDREADQRAKQLVDEGLREESSEKLGQAAELRPHDPRYMAYQAALELANGNTPDYRLRLSQSLARWDSNYWNTMRTLGDRDSEEARRYTWETRRRVHESYLEVFDWAIAIERGRDPVQQERIARLESVFCKLHGDYVGLYGDTERSAAFLVFGLVGGSGCQQTP